MLENSALETLYGGQFTPSTQLIKTNDPSLSACLSVCLSVSAFLPAFPFSVSLFSPPLPVCFSFHFFQPFTIYFCSFSFLSFSFPSYCLLWYKVLLFWKYSIRHNVPFFFGGCPMQRHLWKKHRLINYSKLSSGKVWNNTNDDLLLNQSR